MVGAGSSTDRKPPQGELSEGFARLRSLSKSSLVAQRLEKREIKKMVCVVSDLMELIEEEMVPKAAGRPMMQAVSADGTPVVLNKTISHRLWGKKRRREGKSCREYLVQTSFLRFLDQLGKATTSARCCPPVALTKGLGTEAIREVTTARMRSLRQLGHKGFAINAYCFDRKGLDKLARMCHDFHEGEKDEFGTSELESWMLSLTEWTVVVGCCLHDLHNALKWALYEESHDKELMKQMFVIYASLRNSFDEIQQNICIWLLQTVMVVDDSELPPEAELVEFWESMSCDPEQVENLARTMRVWFDRASGRLLVSKAWASAEGVDVMHELTGVVLLFLECRTFNDARWASMRKNAEALLSGLAVGLEPLVAFVRTQPGLLKEHIGGFLNLSPRHVEYLVVCQMAGRLVDRALKMLMADNRLALIIDEVMEVIEEELDHVESRSDGLWARLASLCGNATTGPALKSRCIKTAHVAASFFHFRVMRELNKYPWDLVRGDLEANVDRLLDGPEPEEEIAYKVHTLLTNSLLPRKQVIQALQLLLQAPWTTLSTEQSHAMLAVLRRLRPDLGETMALLRAFLCMANKLLPAISIEDKRLARATASVKAFGAKNPNMARKENLFFKDLMEVASKRERENMPSCSGDRSQLLMRKKSGVFKEKTDEAKQEYDRRLAEHINTSFADLDRKREKALETECELFEKAEKAKEKDSCIQISACRFSQERESFITERWGCSHYNEKTCDALTSRLLEAPAPSRVAPDPVSAVEKAARPVWFSDVCSRRQHFGSCAFVFGTEPNCTYFDFLLARQNGPMMIYFAEMRALPTPPLSSLASSSTDFDVSHKFEVLRGSYTPWDCLEEIRQGKVVKILAGVRRVGNWQATTAEMPVPITAFLAGLPPLPHVDKKPKAASSSTAGLPKEYLAKYPHMAKPLATVKFKQPLQTVPPEEYIDILDREVDTKQDSDAETTEVFFDGLEWKRVEWAMQGVGIGGLPFRITMRKGAFTKQKTGRDFDTCQVKYAKDIVESFCRNHGLPAQAGYATLLFGERDAIMMARTWQHKMVYFYSLYLAQERDHYTYTDADVAGWEEPQEFTRAVREWTDRQRTERVGDIRILRPM